ncbi:MAG: hypothetical protein SNJ56_07180, partial [Termitinemataceae bacterium]
MLQGIPESLSPEQIARGNKNGKKAGSSLSIVDSQGFFDSLITGILSKTNSASSVKNPTLIQSLDIQGVHKKAIAGLDAGAPKIAGSLQKDVQNHNSVLIRTRTTQGSLNDEQSAMNRESGLQKLSTRFTKNSEQAVKKQISDVDAQEPTVFAGFSSGKSVGANRRFI